MEIKTNDALGYTKGLMALHHFKTTIQSVWKWTPKNLMIMADDARVENYKHDCLVLAYDVSDICEIVDAMINAVLKNQNEILVIQHQIEQIKKGKGILNARGLPAAEEIRSKQRDIVFLQERNYKILNFMEDETVPDFPTQIARAYTQLATGFKCAKNIRSEILTMSGASITKDMAKELAHQFKVAFNLTFVGENLVANWEEHCGIIDTAGKVVVNSTGTKKESDLADEEHTTIDPF